MFYLRFYEMYRELVYNEINEITHEMLVECCSTIVSKAYRRYMR